MSKRWVIKNAAPLDERLKMWGDYHFGEALARALGEFGIDAVNQHYGAWEGPDDGDAVLVLRGKRRYQLPSTNRAGRYLIWVISHPADVSVEELRDFDHVFVCSEIHRERLARAGVAATVLGQCTDPARFHLPAATTTRRGFVFVGNTRSTEREVVRLAVEQGLPLSIFGRGWAAFGLGDRVLDNYVANEDLGTLYRTSRLTLNDHWADMREYGYVNNRVFDALACGLPVLSDWNPGLDALDLPGLLTYRDAEEFRRCAIEVLLRYPSLLRAAESGAERVLQEHTFARRARVLADAVSG